MTWAVEFLPEARKELAALEGSVRMRVLKAIERVRQSPWPSTGDAQGRVGLGKPLGSRQGANLTGLLKVKLKSDGIRIVYKLVERDGVLLVVVIAARADDEVYRRAALRRDGHGL